MGYGGIFIVGSIIGNFRLWFIVGVNEMRFFGEFSR